MISTATDRGGLRVASTPAVLLLCRPRAAQVLNSSGGGIRWRIHWAGMIVIVAGVSGSGKTTVGAMLAGHLHWRFADGDDFHPAANIEKMRAGIPLTDADRWPWLRSIAAWMDERIAQGESAVIPCSALKRSYRDILLNGRRGAQLIFLAVDPDVLAQRLAARHGHFFHVQLLGSQLDALEPPQPGEHTVTVIEHRADQPADTVAAIIALLPPDDDAGAAAPDDNGEAGT